MRQYISIRELQEVLGVSRSTAYALAKRADFPAARIGKKLVVSEEALREWLARGGTQQREA